MTVAGEIASLAFTHCTKMKFSIKDFFSKWDQIRRKLWIWSHLLKKFLGTLPFLCSDFCHRAVSFIDLQITRVIIKMIYLALSCTNLHGVMEKVIFRQNGWRWRDSIFFSNAAFLYPLKTSENCKVLWCFQGVEEG